MKKQINICTKTSKLQGTGVHINVPTYNRFYILTEVDAECSLPIEQGVNDGSIVSTKQKLVNEKSTCTNVEVGYKAQRLLLLYSILLIPLQ